MNVRTIALAVFALICLWAEAFARSPPKLDTFVIGPSDKGALQDLFDHPEQWQQLRAQTGTLLIVDHDLRGISDADLHRWFAAMQRWNMRLELEVGAIKPWGPTADEVLRKELPIWDRAIQQGADLQSIAMDEPLSATRAQLHKDDEYAVEQVAQFVKTVRQRYPAVLVGDVEPFPSISAADHVEWLRRVQRRLQELGVKPLDFYRLDVNWTQFTKNGKGTWSDVLALSNNVRRMGVPFSLIFWASGYPSLQRQGLASEDTWYIGVMSQGYAVASLDSDPDQYVLESWIGVPTKGVPESDPYSFSGTALAFTKKFVKKQETQVKH